MNEVQEFILRRAMQKVASKGMQKEAGIQDWWNNQKETWSRIKNEGLVNFIKNSYRDIDYANEGIRNNLAGPGVSRGRGAALDYDRLMEEMGKPITDSTPVLNNGQVGLKLGDYRLLKKMDKVPRSSLTPAEHKQLQTMETPDSYIYYRVGE
jgi:hypothetical protein